MIIWLNIRCEDWLTNKYATKMGKRQASNVLILFGNFVRCKSLTNVNGLNKTTELKA